MDETEDLIVNHAMGALPISARPTTDIIGGFPEKSDNCKGCGKPLSLENAPLTDGCPCNSPLGINSMNETRWRLLMMHQQSQALQLASAVERAEEWKRAAENQNRQWAAKCEEATEFRAAKEKAERCLQSHGYVRCDAPACNCGSWHPRGGLYERMRELESALGEAGHPLSNENGNLVLNALRELIADRDRLAGEVARKDVALERIASMPPGCPMLDLNARVGDAKAASYAYQRIARAARAQPAPDSKDLK